MTVIGVDQGEGDLQLHSCSSCGQHVWRRDGQEVDRATLLEALRVAPKIRVPKTVAAPTAGDGDARRAELTSMLTDFTVHGSTS